MKFARPGVPDELPCPPESSRAIRGVERFPDESLRQIGFQPAADAGPAAGKTVLL
jgi:hypothetical protein